MLGAFTVQIFPPGEETTLYDWIGVPPLNPGTHETVALPALALTATDCTGLGIALGVTVPFTDADADSPTALVANTETE